MENKFKGTLLGLATGDAMGAPLEFMSKESIAIRRGEVTEMIGGGCHNLFPGQYTDDTTMMLALAESIAEKKILDTADVASRYVAWYDTSPEDIGNTTRTALAFIKEGTPLAEASKSAHEATNAMTAGNGTVMRTAPIALLHCGNAKRIIEASVEEARITHWDERAAYGSAALNLIISQCLLATDKKREEIIDNTAMMMKSYNNEIYGLLRGVLRKPRQLLKTSGYVVHTLETAIWHFVKAKSFEHCIVGLVNLGGDTDTIAAVAGAMSGAYLGVEAIPERWLLVLQDRYRIEDIASEIHAINAQTRTQV